MSAETQPEISFDAQRALYDRLNVHTSRTWAELGEALVADLRSILDLDPTLGGCLCTNEGRAATAYAGEGVYLRLHWRESDSGPVRELDCSADGWPLHDVPAEGDLREALLLLTNEMEQLGESAETVISQSPGRHWPGRAHVRKTAVLLKLAVAQLRRFLPTEAASVEPGVPT